MSDPKDGAGLSGEALLERFLLPSRVQRLETALSARTSSLTVVIDRVHNAHNVSAVMRSADAFGLTGIHLVGDNFDFSRGISLGTERWLRIETHENASSAIESLRNAGFTLVITAPEHDPRAGGDEQPAVPVYALPFERKLALVFGNEKRGVSPEFVEAAEIRTFIPMYGFVESFNISVACAIALFCSRVRIAEAAPAVPLLDEKEKDELRREWLRKTVRRADAILRQTDRE